MTARVVLFWDLDGTLLLTGRAGLYAFEEAVEEVTGATVDLEQVSTAGFTDAGVARLVLEHAGQPGDPDTVEAVLRSYERRLPDSLPRREGRVLDGIREVLEDLEGRDDVRSYLLTGNTPAGARTIAVASGWHSAEELAEHEPWLVLDRIPEPAEFRGLLRLDD
jgi:phosphoglycolate phosphatase-like HAD superfamily hydrolase